MYYSLFYHRCHFSRYWLTWFSSKLTTPGVPAVAILHFTHLLRQLAPSALVLVVSGNSCRWVLNDRVVPWYEEHDVQLLRIPTDRGTEYCGNWERHEYQLYLAIEDIDHSKTKARSPQTNGICERFHKTVQDEFYAAAFRKKIYHSLEEIQEDADSWIAEYNTEWTHPGKYCFGKILWQTFLDSKNLADDKILDRLQPTNNAVREVSIVRWCLG